MTGEPPSGPPSALAVPQGMTLEQFEQVSYRLRELLNEAAERTGDFGNDLFVHGSRAKGCAAADADLDIGIRVTADVFDQLVKDRLERVKVGGHRWKTLQVAIQHGRLHTGEAGISGVRNEIHDLINETMGLGFAKGVDMSVICAGGPFDQGPFIVLPSRSQAK